MLRAMLCATCLLACGRSALDEPARADPTPQPMPPRSSSSPLLGHWATFHIGNCINDEAWLSFAERGQLTVTSVDRNFCGPQGVAAAPGTYVETADTVKLDWEPATGHHQLETTYQLVPHIGAPDTEPMGYRFGERGISMRVWHGTPQRFTRMTAETTVSSGERYANATHAEVSFDADITTAAAGSTVTATLKWSAHNEWASDPKRSMEETFTLPCRVTLEAGVRHVRAIVLDQYDGFWKLLTARGLDKSYGWDLDRVIGAFGPDWVVMGDGLLYQAHSGYSQTYFELQHPPPTSP